MQLLIAHGDERSRTALKGVVDALLDGDLDVTESADGKETLEVLLESGSSVVAVIDWDLPGCDGLEICRLVRAYREAGPPYVILLARSDYRIADGLEAGADDCVHTPVQGDELRARINVGRRYTALPWHRMRRGESPAAEGAQEAPAALAAQRSPDGDEGDALAGLVAYQGASSAKRSLGGDDLEKGAMLTADQGIELSAQRSLNGDDLEKDAFLLADEGAQLSAQRSLNGEDLDKDGGPIGGGSCSLESVLVAL